MTFSLAQVIQGEAAMFVVVIIFLPLILSVGVVAVCASPEVRRMVQEVANIE